ncbi:MAG TPA: hypothetical protein VGP70_07650, partial [Actinomadura sp.]|nr:hypothetical protein [Actinomadura sp.]
MRVRHRGGRPWHPSNQGRGAITFATGKDFTGQLRKLADKWNGAHANEKVSIVELPEAADQQRQMLVQNAQTKSDAYDVLNVDAVWTAEFAARRWVVELPQAKAGLRFLVDGFKEGTIPKRAITFKEEESRRRFQDGKLVFHRNWAYVYALAAEDSSAVKGKFEVAPLPGQDGLGSGTLGGNNLAVSAFSRRQATARDFAPGRGEVRRRHHGDPGQRLRGPHREEDRRPGGHRPAERSRRAGRL